MREGKAQREHIFWKLKNFKMTQSLEDTESLSADTHVGKETELDTYIKKRIKREKREGTKC